MVRFPLALLLAAALGAGASAQSVRAVTDDGRTILVHADGTWEEAEDQSVLQPRAEAPPPPAPPRGSAATAPPPPAPPRTVQSASGAYSLRYDASRWTPNQDILGDDDEFGFVLPFGAGYAKVIYEVLPFPVDQFREIVLGNAEAVAIGGVDLVREEDVEVEGGTVRQLEYEVTTDQGLEITFVNSIYSSETFGSLQLVTWTGTAVADRFRDELLRFHRGLVLHTGGR